VALRFVADTPTITMSRLKALLTVRPPCSTPTSTFLPSGCAPPAPPARPKRRAPRPLPADLGHLHSLLLPMTLREPRSRLTCRAPRSYLPFCGPVADAAGACRHPFPCRAGCPLFWTLAARFRHLRWRRTISCPSSRRQASASDSDDSVGASFASEAFGVSKGRGGVKHDVNGRVPDGCVWVWERWRRPCRRAPSNGGPS
jgi:hypothetical protein